MVLSCDTPSLGFRWASGKATTQQETSFTRRCWEMQTQPSGYCEHLLFFASLHICSVPGRDHNIVDLWLFILFPPSGRKELCVPQEKQNIKTLDKQYETVLFGVFSFGLFCLLFFFLLFFWGFFAGSNTHVTFEVCNYEQPLFKQHKNNQNPCPYRSYY